MPECNISLNKPFINQIKKKWSSQKLLHSLFSSLMVTLLYQTQTISLCFQWLRPISLTQIGLASVASSGRWVHALVSDRQHIFVLLVLGI